MENGKYKRKKLVLQIAVLLFFVAGCTTQNEDRWDKRDNSINKKIASINTNNPDVQQLVRLVREFEKEKADYNGSGYIDYIYVQQMVVRQLEKMLQSSIDTADNQKIHTISKALLELDPENAVLRSLRENGYFDSDKNQIDFNDQQAMLFSKLSPSSAVASSYNVLVYQSLMNSRHDGRQYRELYGILRKNAREILISPEAPLLQQMAYLSGLYGFQFSCDASVAQRKPSDNKGRSSIDSSKKESYSVLQYLNDIAEFHKVNMVILPDRVYCFSGEVPEDEIEGGDFLSVFKAEFVGLETLVGMLKLVIGDSNIVMVDEAAKSLWIRGNRSQFIKAFEMVRAIDVPEAEIEIQLELYEVSSSLLHRIGARVPQLIRAGIGNAMDGGAMNWNTWISQAKSKSMRVMINDGAFQLSAQSRNQYASTLSQPRVRVQDGQRARLFVGDKTPVFSSTVGQGGFVSESVNYVSTGVTLEVEAKIVGPRTIQVAVNIDATELGAPVTTPSGSSANAVTSRTTVTRLTIEDGATEALGGYVRRMKTKLRDGLPIIGATDLSPLGGVRETQETDVELLIFITPKILKVKSSPSRKLLLASQKNSPKYAAPLIITPNMNSPVRMLFQVPQLNGQVQGISNPGAIPQMNQFNMQNQPVFQGGMNPVVPGAQPGAMPGAEGAVGGRGGAGGRR